MFASCAATHRADADGGKKAKQHVYYKQAENNHNSTMSKLIYVIPLRGCHYLTRHISQASTMAKLKASERFTLIWIRA